MTTSRDPQGEMRNLLLDRDTADRLLAGQIDPDDAPPGYAELASVLRAAARPGVVDPARERATVAAMSVALQGSAAALPLVAPPIRRRRGARVRLAAVLVGAMLVGTAGLAVAGELPPAAQGLAHDLLTKIGIEVPRPAGAGADPVEGSVLTPPADVSDGPHGRSDEPHGKSDQPHGKSDEPHGKSDEPHGKSDQPHGKSDEPHGKSDEPHGKSDEPHGQADEPHGQSDEPHGQSDQPHGQSDEPHGQSDEPQDPPTDGRS